MIPKITVLMAVYNGQAFLKECIDSVLNQTFKDFEFLIVDDGSTDATMDIIRSYKDDRIRSIKNEKNLSQVASLNIGLEHAEGDYVARIDADDIMFPQRLKKQLDFLTKRTGVALVGSLGHAIDENGKVIAMAKLPIRNEEIIATVLLGGFILVHSSIMFRKNIILDIGKYREDFSFTEDYKLATDLLYEGYKINNMPEPLIKYRLHNDRISVRDSNLQIARYIVALKGFLKTFTPNLSDLDRDFLFVFLFNAGSMNLEYWRGGICREKIQKIILFLGMLLNNVSNHFKFSSAEKYFMKKIFFKWILNFAYQGRALRKDLSMELYKYSFRNWFFIFENPKLHIYPICSGITNWLRRR